MVAQAIGVLTPDELNTTDERVLGVLRGGRVTPQYVAEEIDVSRTYSSERLKRLVEHNHVKRAAPGLYELVDDPTESPYNKLGEELDWEKLGPVDENSVDRLEYVLESLEEANELSGDLTWSTVIAETPSRTLTIEELLGGLGEAKHLLQHSREQAEDIQHYQDL